MSEEALGYVHGVLPWDPRSGRRGKQLSAQARGCARRILSELFGYGVNFFMEKANKQPFCAMCCGNPRGPFSQSGTALKRLLSTGRAGSGEHQEYPESRSYLLEHHFGAFQ